MTTSVTSLSTASIVLPRSLENESFLDSPITRDLLDEDMVLDALSYGPKAIQAIIEGFQSGSKLVGKHWLKTVTLLLLALQNQGSLITISGATALSVTNSNQVLTGNGSAVALLPMSISGNAIGDRGSNSNATLVLRDKNSGNISSSCDAGQTQTFSNGVWNSFGITVLVNNLLGCITVTPAPGYLDTTMYIDSTFIDYIDYYPTESVEGTIEINPPMTSIPSNPIQTPPSTKIVSSTVTSENSGVSLTTQAVSPTNSENSSSNANASLTTQSPSNVSHTVATLLSNSNQNTTNGTNDSNNDTIATPSIVHGTTTSTHGSTDTSSFPLILSTSKPPYAIIGGTVGGGLLLCSLIAGIAAFVHGWCGMHKESSPAEVHDHELQTQHCVPDEGRSNYALIVVAQPQKPIKSDYTGLPEASIRSQYDLTPQANLGSKVCLQLQ